MRNSRNVFNLMVAVIFALTQILPCGSTFALDDHINKNLKKIDRDMTASFAPNYIYMQQAMNIENEKATKENVDLHATLENTPTKPEDITKKDIKKPEKENVTLRKPQEMSGGTEQTTTTTTKIIVIGGSGEGSNNDQDNDTGSGTGTGTGTGGTKTIVRDSDGKIIIPDGPRKEGIDENGKHYIRTYDDLGRLTYEYIEDRGTLARTYDDAKNTVTITADFNPVGTGLPEGYTTGGDNNLGWTIINGAIVPGAVTNGQESWLETKVDLTNINGNIAFYFDYPPGAFADQITTITIYDVNGKSQYYSGPCGDGRNTIWLQGGKVYTARWTYRNNAAQPVQLYIDNVSYAQKVVETFDSLQAPFTPVSGTWKVVDGVYQQSALGIGTHYETIMNDANYYNNGNFSIDYKMANQGDSITLDCLDRYLDRYLYGYQIRIFASTIPGQSSLEVYIVSAGIAGLSPIAACNLDSKAVDPNVWHKLSICDNGLYACIDDNSAYSVSLFPMAAVENIKLGTSDLTAPAQFDNVTSYALDTTETFIQDSGVPFTPLEGTWEVIEDGTGNFVYTQEAQQNVWVKTIMNGVEAKAGNSIEYRFRPIGSSSGDFGGLLFGLKDNRGYLVSVDWVASGAGMNLYSVNLQNNECTWLQNAVLTLDSGFGGWHTMKVDLSTNSAKIFLDGSERIQASDLDLSGGGIGFATYTYDNMMNRPTMYFDDIKVTTQSPYTIEHITTPGPKADVPATTPTEPPKVVITDDSSDSTSTTPPTSVGVTQRYAGGDRSRFILPQEYIKNQKDKPHTLTLTLYNSDRTSDYQRKSYREYERELRQDLSSWTPLTSISKPARIQESLQSFMRMLVNKPKKTTQEERMIEVLEVVMSESRYLDTEVMEEFERAIQRIRVAEKMRDVLNATDLKTVSDAMADLSKRQKDLYREYLSLTSATYRQLEKLLVTQDNEIPDEYMAIASANPDAARKILVDLELFRLELLAKDPNAKLTDAQKKALEINASKLQPIRDEYTKKMTSAIKKFITIIKDTLRNISGSSALNVNDVSTNSLKMLFLLDKGIV